MTAQALTNLRDSILTERKPPKINLDEEWFPCPHCGDSICTEMETAIFNDDHLLFFCGEDCETEYCEGRKN